PSCTPVCSQCLTNALFETSPAKRFVLAGCRRNLRAAHWADQGAKRPELLCGETIRYGQMEVELEYARRACDNICLLADPDASLPHDHRPHGALAGEEGARGDLFAAPPARAGSGRMSSTPSRRTSGAGFRAWSACATRSS